MVWHWIAIVGVAAALGWTLAPRLRSPAWWVRAFEFPRVQFAVLTLAVGCAVWLADGMEPMLRVGSSVVVLACLADQLYFIAPYTPLFPCQMRDARGPLDGDRLSILVANVYMPNRNSERLVQIIRSHDPDLVLTLESDAWWQSQLDSLSVGYPYSVEHPRDNTYGMHLYSRLPLENPQVLFLVEDDVPSIHATLRLPSGHPVKLHCVHPAPPSPTENATAIERDAELLIVARDVDPSRDSVIVTGDLNDVAWSSTTRLFQRLSGLLDPRVGRGIYGTFHARTPFLRWPLDHVFASSDFSLVALEVLECFGSDHLPVLVELGHADPASEAHTEPRPEDGDESRARRKIRRADADDASIPDD